MRRTLLRSLAGLSAWQMLPAEAAAGAVEDAPAQPASARWPRATVHPALHLVGDSTLADKPLAPPQPERGRGQALRGLLREPARLVNHAVNGRSTHSFLHEGRWAHVLGQLQAGDQVLLQFGHNDQKREDPSRFADARGAYSDNLRRFVAGVRARGATPLLATSVARRKFDAQGQLVDTLGDYPAAMRAVAAELQVPLLDLNQATSRLLQQLGPEPAKALFMWIAPGVWPSLPEGRQDDTHFVEAGALAVAQLALQAMRAQQLVPPGGWA